MPAPYEKHRAQLKAILLAWGMPEDNAEATADILSWADLHGVDSHGLSMIPGYDRLRRAGRANMAARPRIIKETPVSALVDGDGGLGHVPARFAMQVAIDKAKQSGMAIAAVRNSAHFGATGYYTLMAAKEGLIGMACTSASSSSRVGAAAVGTSVVTMRHLPSGSVSMTIVPSGARKLWIASSLRSEVISTSARRKLPS